MGIDTHEVLAAAGTKWNFLPFKPGLVGGHCIGVDPYYLAQKAQEVGYHPEIILAGRRLNDSMGQYVASEIVKLMAHRDLRIKRARVLMLGITFKENCPDIRNTRAVDIFHELCSYDMDVNILDPWADPEEVRHEYGVTSYRQFEELPQREYEAIVLAVSHKEFAGLDLKRFKTPSGVIYDVKGALPKDQVDGRL
jgi:UDP-N-acetyl-D-galactosamine dehydrogenase